MRGAALFAALVAPAGCRLETHEPERRPGATSVLLAAADSAAVLEELEGYYRDFSARDWVAFADHFWPDADITTIWQPPGEDSLRVVVTSIPDFVAQAPRGPGSRQIFQERMVEARIVTFGPLAQAWVRYHALFGDPGAVAEWRGMDAFTLLRHGGRWRIVELAFAGDEAGS
jgi:hypothetical protein